MKELASSWFVDGLRSLGMAAAHDVPPIASENYGTISLSTLTRTSGGGTKVLRTSFRLFSAPIILSIVASDIPLICCFRTSVGQNILYLYHLSICGSKKKSNQKLTVSSALRPICRRRS